MTLSSTGASAVLPSGEASLTLLWSPRTIVAPSPLDARFSEGMDVCATCASASSPTHTGGGTNLAVSVLSASWPPWCLLWLRESEGTVHSSGTTCCGGTAAPTPSSVAENSLPLPARTSVSVGPRPICIVAGCAAEAIPLPPEPALGCAAFGMSSQDGGGERLGGERRINPTRAACCAAATTEGSDRRSVVVFLSTRLHVEPEHGRARGDLRGDGDAYRLRGRLVWRPRLALTRYA